MRARCSTRWSRTPGRGRARRRRRAGGARELRHAQRIWLELDAPYEVARTRVLVAQACSALGDDEAAALELEAAREIFERLGAAPDLARLSTRGRHAARPVGARARGPAPRRRGEEQPRDRDDARHQRAHRRAAPAEHLREARPLLARGGDRLRVRARARLGRAWSEMTTRRAAQVGESRRCRVSEPSYRRLQRRRKEAGR